MVSTQCANFTCIKINTKPSASNKEPVLPLGVEVLTSTAVSTYDSVLVNKN